MRSSNSTVMDILLVGDSYANDSNQAGVGRITQQQYDDRLYKSFQKQKGGSHDSNDHDVLGTPVHPVYDVIYEVELTAKDSRNRRKLDLIVKCPRLITPSSSNSPVSSRTDAVSVS